MGSPHGTMGNGWTAPGFIKTSDHKSGHSFLSCFHGYVGWWGRKEQDAWHFVLETTWRSVWTSLAMIFAATQHVPVLPISWLGISSIYPWCLCFPLYLMKYLCGKSHGPHGSGPVGLGGWKRYETTWLRPSKFRVFHIPYAPCMVYLTTFGWFF